MLVGGASVEYLREFAGNKDNAIIFVCYQGIGSIGRRIEEGERELNFMVGGSKKQEALNEFQLAVQLEPKNENAKAWIQKMLSEK